jgi:ATP phosphoribosyltransferase regulatory subunit
MTPMPKPAAALLPPGFNDLLAPDAAREAEVVEALIAYLAARGCERVKPPLVEFEETLLGGPGAAMTAETFRLMDPASHRMMAVRADMTLQIARIAAARLARAPRPLRLCYAGQVLRVSGSQLRPERQFTQVGAELIGAVEAAADAEMATRAAGALAAVGAVGISLDLSLPTLVPAVVRASRGVEGDAASLRHALDRKDSAGVAATGGSAAPLLLALMAASGPAEAALAAAEGLALPPAASAELARLAEVARLVGARAPGLDVTIDFVENRGFEYHTGVSFTLFARAVRGELGRGGRYAAGGEPSTGFTLFMDTVLSALPAAAAPRRAFLPHGMPPAAGEAARAQGWVTVEGLAPAADAPAEAARLACDAFWDGARLAPVPRRSPG